MSKMILSPAEMLAAFIALIVVSPAFASAASAGLRARLADRGDRDHLVFFHVVRDDGIGGTIAEAELLADLDRKAAAARRNRRGRRR